MSFLDPIPEKIMNKLRRHFRTGTVKRAELTGDNAGGFTAEFPVSEPKVAVLMVEFSVAYRAQNAVPEDAVAFMILRHGLGFELNLDDQLVYDPNGKTYMILAPIMSDPAQAQWSFSARPI